MMAAPLEVQAGKLLLRRKLSLALAESCTGGLISDRITNIAGSSEYYAGGITAYSNQVKVTHLGVRPETLRDYGAVSRETVLEMARGARQALSTDIGLSVSGIAGPAGGTPEKPVGLTWIGLSADGFEQAWSYTLKGDRLSIKAQAAEEALRLLVEYLKEGDMATIEVVARFDPDGKIWPVRFTWQNQNYTVTATGRRWEGEDGHHMLVMVPGERVYELVYSPAEAVWRLGEPGGIPHRA